VKRVAVLPMDDRPVNYDSPRYLSRAAGMEVLLPPRGWLGNPWRPSRHRDLVDWLSRTAAEADAAIVAIDTLGYGGLIPSRTSSEPAESVLGLLGIIRRLKAEHPTLPILASSVVMRINRSNSCEEEKPYWATFGGQMFRLSFLEHKAELGEADPGEIGERDRLRAEIPDDVYRDYRRGRARNHAVNRAMLDWVAEGIFDYLLLPQDDTADYGWNVSEARSLQSDIRDRGLDDRAITYPGADEIGCLLLARYVCRQNGFGPKVWPRYSSVAGPTVVTAYEDRPFQELIKAHLAPLGGTLADSPNDADLLLFVNSPVEKQGNGDSQWIVRQGAGSIRKGLPAKFQPWLDRFCDAEGFRATRREIESPGRNPEAFVQALLGALATGKPVALADVAFVNASDLVLGDLLLQQPAVTGLAGYGGWNTAGNTLGTVLAQAVIQVLSRRSTPTPDQRAAHLEFLFMRFLDDDAYQARERTRCMVCDLPSLDIAPTMERLPEDVAKKIEGRVRSQLQLAAAALRRLFVSSRQVGDVRVDHIHLPWNRLFEVGFDVTVNLD